MAESKKVFLTSNVLEAFIDRAHPKYDQASAFFRFFGEDGYMLYVDINSINLTYQAIYKDISPSLARDFLRIMMLSDINIVYPEDADTKAAVKALTNFGSTDLTFPEALIGVLADKRGISQICSFDYFHPLFGQTIFYLPL